MLSAALSVTLYIILHSMVPVTYQLENLFIRYAVVEWLPLLLTPLLVLFVADAKSDQPCSLDTALVVQWGSLIGVNWTAAFFHSGVWMAYGIFAYPILAMTLSALPPLLFVVLQPLRGWKITVWPGILMAAAGGAGIELLFRVQRWVSGMLLLMVLAVFVLSVAVLLNRMRTTGK